MPCINYYQVQKGVDSMTSDTHISKEEWDSLLKQIDDHHSLFYRLGQMGKPVLTTSIETASVSFDKGGDFISFNFNPDFWKECDTYKKLFVICHECLHIMLNHGIRTVNIHTNNRPAANTCLDVVVNHMLTRVFKFDKTKIKDWEKLCWVDTVFINDDGTPKVLWPGYLNQLIPDNETYEYYVNKLPVKDVYPLTLDNHEGLKECDFEDIIESVLDKLSDEEVIELDNLLDEHQDRGTASGGLTASVNLKKIKRKKKWESVIKDWSIKTLAQVDKHYEQWARQNRRFTLLPQSMFLPSEMEIQELKSDKNKIEVHFFLDTSGSCWDLKDRFFSAAESLPKKRFKIRLFCFDTKVKETNLESKTVYGGGGTSFDIIEDHILKLMKEEKTPYPEAVFVITDGYGNHVNPFKPTNWHWFVSGSGMNTLKTLTSKECHFYRLANFV